MKYAQMVCASSRNIGDDIQSIAAAAALPRVDLHADREQLGALHGPDPICLVMNAFFMHGSCWPPSDVLRPVFVGFHVAPHSRSTIARHAEYLKRHEPIGTRDVGTAAFLGTLGVKTDVTYCMSLTFPRRLKAPARGKVITVDADRIEVPAALRRGAIRVTHRVAGIRDTTRLQCARDLVEFYRDNARLIITTRLHCALPCLAMGIPVVLFGDSTSYRMDVVRDIGGIVYDERLHRHGALGKVVGRLEPVDWSPQPVDTSTIATGLRATVAMRLAALTASAGRVAR